MPGWSRDAEDRARVERAAMEAILDSERVLGVGNVPKDISDQEYGSGITPSPPTTTRGSSRARGGSMAPSRSP